MDQGSFVIVRLDLNRRTAINEVNARPSNHLINLNPRKGQSNCVNTRGGGTAPEGKCSSQDKRCLRHNSPFVLGIRAVLSFTALSPAPRPLRGGLPEMAPPNNQ